MVESTISAAFLLNIFSNKGADVVQNHYDVHQYQLMTYDWYMIA